MTGTPDDLEPTPNVESVSPIRRATAEFSVARWLKGEGPQRDRPSHDDLRIAGYTVVRTRDLEAPHPDTPAWAPAFAAALGGIVTAQRLADGTWVCECGERRSTGVALYAHRRAVHDLYAEGSGEAE